MAIAHINYGGRASAERRLGWKDSEGWIALAVLALVVIHQLADAITSRYLGPVASGVAVISTMTLAAIWFGFALLGWHREVRNELTTVIKGKDALQIRTSGLLEKLNHSLVQIEQHNERLSLLGKFNHRVHACESEQQIVDLVRECVPDIVGSEQGVLYCSTPERELRRAIQWPENLVAEDTIRQARCEAIRKAGRMEGEFGSCRACSLSDPTRVVCIPLRSGRTVAGLLQLTISEKQSASFVNSPDDAIMHMAADQLALALCNARSRQHLGDIVMRDGLTGAFNRRYMEEALQREISRSARSNTPLSILMIDLDHFKQVNDTMGHAVGDSVLKELAKTLGANVRASDIVCRYGGEEFLVALPDTSAIAAKGKADALRRQIHEISGVVKHHRMISASMGVAAMPEHGTDLKTLLRAADGALYDAKHAGRDRVVIAKSSKLIRPSWDVIEATLSRWDTPLLPEVLEKQPTRWRQSV